MCVCTEPLHWLPGCSSKFCMVCEHARMQTHRPNTCSSTSFRIGGNVRDHEMASKTSLHSLCLPFSLFFSPSNGALRTQKCMQVPSQRTPKFSLLKPGADQNIALHSWPTDMDSAFVRVAFLIHSTSFLPNPLQRLIK